jgi:hypothetical protein
MSRIKWTDKRSGVVMPGPEKGKIPEFAKAMAQKSKAFFRLVNP